MLLRHAKIFLTLKNENKYALSNPYSFADDLDAKNNPITIYVIRMLILIYACDICVFEHASTKHLF